MRGRPACHESLPRRPQHLPRGAGAWADCSALANRALGFSAAAHAELDERVCLATSTRATTPKGSCVRVDVAGMLARYARSISAPVFEGVEVTAVDRQEGRSASPAPTGEIRCRGVVIATATATRPPCHAPPRPAGRNPPGHAFNLQDAKRSPRRRRAGRRCFRDGCPAR